MCGILGLVSNREIDPALAGHAQELLRHRGPDGSGSLHLVKKDGRQLLLVNTRLSIIDIEEGAQPMWDAQRRWVTVLNGEIYNYVELRQELASDGCQFRTNSDTEVLVTAIAHWGAEKAIPRLNGMFAFAAYCPAQDELVLARDRFGIKPLYLIDRGDELTFSSELGALIRMGLVEGRIDETALELYLTQYSLPAPWSILRGAAKLKPAYFLRVSGGRKEFVRYWNPRWTIDIRDPVEAVDTFDRHMVASLKRQFRSDVPVGISLSGGLDSSSLLAYSTQELGMHPVCYSLAFDEPRWDESSLSRQMADHAGSTIEMLTVNSVSILEQMRMILTRYGEPMGDWGVGLVGLVSRLARAAHKVLLVGAGGDELFAGYPTVNAYQYARAYRRLPGAVRRAVNALIGAMPLSEEHMSLGFKLRRFVNGAGEAPEIAHLKYKEVFSAGERAALLGRAPTRGHEDILANIDLLSLPEHQERLLWIDLNTFMQSNVLAGFDAASMAHGVEMRVPFLDNEMYDFSLRLDPRLKFSLKTTKPLVRMAVRNRVPRSIREAPKRGFDYPADRWFREELRGTVDTLLSMQNIEALGLQPDIVWRYWNEHKEGRRCRGRQIAALLSLVMWRQEFFGDGAARATFERTPGVCTGQ